MCLLSWEGIKKAVHVCITIRLEEISIYSILCLAACFTVCLPFTFLCPFLKLKAHGQEAKIIALSSVVSGKEVESEAIALHRGLECESVLCLFEISLCITIFLFKLKCQVQRQTDKLFAPLYPDMVKEWPRQQLQTKAAMKKERPLREKVLADVRKKVAQVQEILKPALENASVAANISNTAEQIAQSAAKVLGLFFSLHSAFYFS